ncbi:MAG: YbhN family protein [Actinomycetota bacterium]
MPEDLDLEAQVPHRKKRPWWQQALSFALTVAVLVAVFGFVIPQLADYREILEFVGDISTTTWLVLAALALAFLIAYPIVLMQVISTLRFREAFANHMTGTAVTNAIPSGGAIALPLNYAMYMSWGITPHAISAGLLAAGVWDWLARIALPVLAVLGVAAIGEALGWMWLVSIGGVIFVAVALVLLIRLTGNEGAAASFAGWLDRLADRVYAKIHKDKPDVTGIVIQFRDDLHETISTSAWRLSFATIWNHVAMTAIFAASIYAVGVTPDLISIPWVVLAFTLGRFIVMIPVSPGGLGLVDLGWIGLLTLGWQTTNPSIPVDTSLISAGVLLFRALTLLPPILIGVVTGLFWRFNKSWRQDWKTVRRGDVTA